MLLFVGDVALSVVVGGCRLFVVGYLWLARVVFVDGVVAVVGCCCCWLLLL